MNDVHIWLVHFGTKNLVLLWFTNVLFSCLSQEINNNIYPVLEASSMPGAVLCMLCLY